MPTNSTYDAIVVGSGISGGWAAKELCERGLKTLMLERGRNVEHVKDYVNAMKAPWQFPHRGKPVQNAIEEHPILHRSGALNELNFEFWADENECPYTEVKKFNWIRGYQVGGRSLTWGRQTYRLSDFDFEANAREGVGADWPIRYKDIAPWYDYVEKFAGISGSKENLPQLPDGHFLPAMEMNCVEKDVASRLKEYYKGRRSMIIGRTANLTQPLQSRLNCQYRNLCSLGCPFGAYFSTQSSTLPAAFKTGNLTLRPWSIVTQILYDKENGRAVGVQVLDAESNLTYEYRAKVVFLNASALNSTWVLMNSATDVWEGGLGSRSGELGHNLMDHHMSAGATATVEGYMDMYVYGRRPNQVYIPRYRNLFGDKRDYLRGFGYQGAASREGWSREIAELSIGAEYKDALLEPGEWTMGIIGFGETLPYHENKVSIDRNRKDKWGLNVLAIDAELKENEQKMAIDMRDDAAEMLDAVGLKDVKPYTRNFVMGNAVHEMGTARMGNSPRTSVLNEWNQVWDCKNVFLTDGACMTSGGCVNPSLTYMALTARAVDYAVDQLNKRNL